MTNDFFRNIPRYNDDSDFTTNSESYYKDLARKQKLIKLLAERIWEYDEEIAKYFERWEHNLETINEDVIEMMITWLEDGTLDEILNEELMNRKPEIYITESEPETSFQNVYWYQEVGN